MAVSNRVKNGSSMVGGVDSSYGTNMLRDSISNPKIPSMSKNSKIIPVDVSYQGNTAALGVNGQNNPNFIELPSAKSKQKSPQIHTFGDQIDSQAMTYSANGIGGNNALPQNLLYKDNLVNLQNANNAVDNGGVTDEGVILGNPNVENATTNVNDDSSDNQTKPLFDRLVESAKKILNKDSADSTEDDTSEGGDVDTYEEFLNKQEGLYKQWYEDLLAQIEAERQRGVVDARSSYAQNLATYGANAEQLAAMGLSGSGYSDYLNQQAYATQRAETQGANAQAESNKMQAELSYAENMMNLEQSKMEYNEQKQAEQKSIYAELLAYINKGTYDEEQAKTIGKQYGLPEEWLNSLSEAALSYESNLQNELYNSILQDIQSGLQIDPTLMDSYLKTEKLSQEHYDILKKLYQDQQQEFINTDMFNGVSEDDAKKYYDSAMENMWLSNEQKNQIKEYYDKEYNPQRYTSGNKPIEFEGSQYKLKEKLGHDDNKIRDNNSFKEELAKLGFTDPYDKNIPNGTTVEIKHDAYGSDKTDWKDFVGWLLGPTNIAINHSVYSATLTYYNGEWYISEKS